jgi:hypothetical protein
MMQIAVPFGGAVGGLLATQSSYPVWAKVVMGLILWPACAAFSWLLFDIANPFLIRKFAREQRRAELEAVARFVVETLLTTHQIAFPSSENLIQKEALDTIRRHIRDITEGDFIWV